jgi:hypothetical protein
VTHFRVLLFGLVLGSSLLVPSFSLLLGAFFYRPCQPRQGYSV